MVAHIPGGAAGADAVGGIAGGRGSLGVDLIAEGLRRLKVTCGQQIHVSQKIGRAGLDGLRADAGARRRHFLHRAAGERVVRNTRLQRKMLWQIVTDGGRPKARVSVDGILGAEDGKCTVYAAICTAHTG